MLQINFFLSFLLVLSTCQELKNSGQTHSGTYMVDPDGPNAGVEPFEVYCDMATGTFMINSNIIPAAACIHIKFHCHQISWNI